MRLNYKYILYKIKISQLQLFILYEYIFDEKKINSMYLCDLLIQKLVNNELVMNIH